MPETDAAGAIEWLGSGARAFPAMLGAIALSRTSVRLETFIFGAGHPGDAFLAAMTDAARRGVRVQVLVDALGSSNLADAYWRPLREAGGTVVWFNPFRSFRALVRDHRKLLVCDDRIAFVGGFNVASEYDGDGIANGWRDAGVRIRGPLAAGLGRLMDDQRAAGDGPHPMTVRWRRRAAQSVPTDAGFVRVLAVTPGRGPSVLADSLASDLAEAREITLVTPYFLPPPAIRRALRTAARRGANVRVVLPARSDVRMAQMAARWLYAGLLRAGVAIHEYEPRMLHAKVFLVGDAVYVGSSNLDPRSLHLNYEIMLRVTDPELVAAARADVVDMLGRSRSVDRRGWARSRGWWERLREWWAFLILYRIDPLLTGWIAWTGK